ncbi:MAG: endonuclease III [Actinomycetota bacterium]
MPQIPRFLAASGYDPQDAKKRIKAIVRELSRAYPGARTALTYNDCFQLLVATILSAQCTDEVVNRVTPVLFERYPTPEALASANPSDVEGIIRPTGFFRQKTKAIVGTAQKIVSDFGGELPRTMAELTTLKGVARKTANVVLANCHPRPGSDHGIFVDTHIRRISQRLALTDNEDPVKIERDLMALLPRNAWVDIPHALILLGRGPCTARNPYHEACPLLRWCPTGREALAAAAPAPAHRRTAGAPP